MGGYMAWRPAPHPQAGMVSVFMPPLATLDGARARLMVGEARPRTVMDAILAGVGEAAGVPVSSIVGPRGRDWVVDARLAAYAAARRVGRILAGRGGASYPDSIGRRCAAVLTYPLIAQRVGGRDHSTVVSGVQRCEARIAAGDHELLRVVQAGVAAGLRYHRERGGAAR